MVKILIKEVKEKTKKKGKKFRLKLTIRNRNSLLKIIEKRVERGEKIRVYTPNPEMVVLGLKDQSFGKILNKGDYNLPDGAYLFWARWIEEERKALKKEKKKGMGLRERLRRSGFWLGVRGAFELHFRGLARQRLAGADFMVDLCRLANKRGWGVFLLGAAPGVAQKAGERLKRMIPGLKIEGCFAGDGSPQGDKETVGYIKKVAKNRKIHLLFVAYGMGKQERWIARNLPKIPVNLAMGVGGSFDYLVSVPRAPLWMRERGLEWLYRLIRQPWRLRRQLLLFRFIRAVLKGRIELVWCSL